MLNNKNKAVNIGILETSPQNKAILEFYFGSVGKSLYKEVNKEAASAFIIDYDYVGAKQSWDQIFKETNKPGIILSIHEVDLPSTVWIAKPLTAKALTDASEELNKIIAENEAVENTTNTKAIEAVEATSAVNTKQKEVALAGTQFDNFEVAEPVEPLEPTLPQENIPLKSNSELESLNEVSISSPIAEKTENKIDSVDDSAENAIEKPSEIDQLLASLISGRSPKDKAELLIEDKTLASTDTQADTQLDETSSSPIIENREEISLEIQDNEKDREDGSLNLEGMFDITDGTVVEDPNHENESIELAPIELESTTNETVEEFSEEPTTNKNNDLFENEIDSTSVDQHIDTTEFGVLVDVIETENFTEIDQDTEDTTDSTEPNIEIDLPDVLEQSSSVSPKDIVTSAPMESVDSAENELQRLLEEIRQEADSNQLFTQVDSDGNVIEEPDQEFNTAAEKRWNLICGDLEDIMSKSDVKKNCFKPEEHILTTFNQVVEKSKSSKEMMRLKLGRTIIVVDAMSDTVYCNNSILEDAYAKICFNPINKNQIKIHSLDASEVRMIINKQEKSPDLLHSIESFIWTTSLLTAKGRLPQDTDIEKQVGLKHWPNLTRLEAFPHSIQIAAVFKKRTGSLLEITQWLEHIPQSSIFTFYNGVLALGLIELDKVKLKTIKGDSKSSNNKNRGFFSRLLRRITK